ncbi:MAG: alpha-L-rhamnosidase [Kiritimatiellae bacterium]|nr:alpha-L-rhamnosidase [Kiritimatiellia bacterium]
MWIVTEDAHEDSFVSAYRLRFDCEKTARITLLVTADQRYWLYLDGQRIGRGSERGSIRKWFYETYEIELTAGTHTLEAITWYLSDKAPWAQVTAQPGFLLATTDEGFTERLSTGLAPWKSRVLSEITFLDPGKQVGQDIGSGARILHRGRPLAEILLDDSQPWSGVRTVLPGNNAFWQTASPETWVLYPAQLPAMRSDKWCGARVVCAMKSFTGDQQFRMTDSDPDECAAWQSMLDQPSARVALPPHSEWRVLIDLGGYCCAYYQLHTQGGSGAEIAVAWAERLSMQPDYPEAPNDRNTLEARFFVGTADHFQPTGEDSACYEPLWWQAGRWVQVSVRTAALPLLIEDFEILETGYPWRDESRFSSDDEVLNAIAPMCYRTLQCCTHETYMDCPYWEQLQYLGDTRIQSQLTYVTSSDTRLPEKALEIFSHSMLGASPFPASNYPSRGIQIIPPFALWWICMLHDYALWRGNAQFVQELLPMGWWIIDHFLLHRQVDGMLTSPQGWNYVDAAAFPNGEPPGASVGEVSGLLNWQVIIALNALRDLSQWLNVPERADWADRIAQELTTACEKMLWNPTRAALADDLDHTSFSEHGQCLALLTKRLSPRIQSHVQYALTNDPGLVRAGEYFRHYICLALADMNAGDSLHACLHTWREFIDAGLYTLPEHGVHGRSDCHAWSAHPLYHMLSSVLGIRPASLGFESILIRPMPGALREICGCVPHPLGEIVVALKMHANGCSVDITLPQGLTGTFSLEGQNVELQEGNSRFEIRYGEPSVAQRRSKPRP